MYQLEIALSFVAVGVLVGAMITAFAIWAWQDGSRYRQRFIDERDKVRFFRSGVSYRPMPTPRKRSTM